MLIHGDNLQTSAQIKSRSVDLIATDPPFNTGETQESVQGSFNDSWAFGENVPIQWQTDLRMMDEGIAKVSQSAFHNHSESMAAYICFLGIRMVGWRRILKVTGSVYLHCDSLVSPYVRLLLDATFGAKNFRNEIVWKRTHAHNDPKRYARITDRILYYTSSDKYVWNDQKLPLTEETIDKWYKNDDNDGRGPYNRLVLTAPRNGMKTWRGITLDKRSWNAPRHGAIAQVIEEKFIPGYSEIVDVIERLEALDKAKLIHWPKKRFGLPTLKQYRFMSIGKSIPDLFDDLPMMRDLDKERVDYPTQKPIALYERIIRASTNEGDVVLDPFCGSGTTLVAAQNLKRDYIGQDSNEEAISLCQQRLKND